MNSMLGKVPEYPCWPSCCSVQKPMLQEQMAVRCRAGFSSVVQAIWKELIVSSSQCVAPRFSRTQNIGNTRNDDEQFVHLRSSRRYYRSTDHLIPHDPHPHRYNHPLCISLLAQPCGRALMLKSRSKRHPLCNRQRSSMSMRLVPLRQSRSSECIRLHLSRLLVAGEHLLLVLRLVAIPQQGCFTIEW